MRFEWDPRKAERNLRKHGVSFEQAITAFDDPYALRALDLKHSTPDETREWLIGEADMGVLVIVFTIRQPSGVYRLISARTAKRKERKKYEELKKFPI